MNNNQLYSSLSIGYELSQLSQLIDLHIQPIPHNKSMLTILKIMKKAVREREIENIATKQLPKFSLFLVKAKEK